MGNCKSELGLGLIKFNLNNREEVLKELEDILSVDLDLTENEDYFREDTIHLGYKSEGERIVTEAIGDKDISNFGVFKEVFEKVFSSISDQEFFGMCEYEILELGDGEIVLAYAYGGVLS